MLKNKIFFFILSLGFIVVLCFAQEQDNATKNTYLDNGDVKNSGFNFATFAGEEVNEPGYQLGTGMELIKIRGSEIIAPKGTKVEDKGSWIKIEDIGSYLGRKFDETEKRLDRIELRQNELKGELEQIKQILEGINKRTLMSK